MFSCVGKKSKQVTRDSSVYDTNGRGLCVIIANFTKCGKKKMELSGYKADIKNIKEIFQNDKRYDFEVMDECKDDAGETMKFYNLSKDQFEKALGLIQKKLNKGWGIQRKQYGKFIMFVLSHGNEEGIQMYQQSVKDRQQYITDEEIIDHFSHDYVPSLKGVPKCFFFQACRGPEETRAANKEMGMGESGKLSTNPLPIITRANILVAHATLDQKRAYVRSCGSLFLRHLANQLKKKDLNLDIFSVLTKVIAEVSEEAMGQDFVCNDDGIVIEVEGEDGFAPTILIGKGKGSNTTEFPLNVSSNQESYDISVLPDDFNFKGDIRVLKKGFEMSCTVPNPGVSAGELDIFASDAFEVEGKLTSKLNPCHFQEGKVKVKDGNILVDGEKLTHGVEVNEMDIVVYKTDKQGKPKEHLCTVEELHQKKTRILIHGKLQGDCTINKVDDVWKAEVGVYQLPVFCSTLTKHLYLTKVGAGFHLYNVLSLRISWRMSLMR